MIYNRTGNDKSITYEVICIKGIPERQKMVKKSWLVVSYLSIVAKNLCL